MPVRYIKRKVAEHRTKKQNETPTDRAARRTATATVWMAVFTFFLATTSGLTIWILKNQLTEMHQGGIDTHALAEATQDASVAASDQADAAQQFSDTAEDINNRMQDAVDQLRAAAANAKASIQATQDSMRQDQRAWVGAGDYTYSVVESGPIESSVILINSGKSPALDMLYKITGTTKLKSDILNLTDIVYPPILPTLKLGSLFPGQHVPFKTGGPPMDSDKQKTWFANVQSRDWIQYFFGEVRYKDTFGRDHWTHFCTQFVPARGSTPASGTPCAIYNDTDDSKKMKTN